MSLRDDLIRINDSLSSTLHGINSLLPFEVENLKNTPPVIEEAIGSARREGEESGYSNGYNEGRENAETIIVDISNEAIEKYTAPAEVWSELPSKIDEVYDAGKAAGGGGDEILQGIDSLYQFFANNFRMELLPRILAMDLSKIGNWQYCFIDNTRLTEFHAPATMKAATPHGLFQRCKNLVTVSGLDRAVSGLVLTDLFNECTSLVDAGTLNFQGIRYANRIFQNCTSLKEVRIAGTIGISLDLHWSTNLSKASIQSIYAALSDAAGMSANTLTLSLTAVNKAFETSEGANDGSTSTEWQNLVSGTPWRTVLN
jgi:hypothetical protein